MRLNLARMWTGVAALLCLAGRPAVSAPAAKLAALIFSGQNNHDWKTTTPALKQALEASGRFTVDVTEHPEQCTAEQLARYDVVVSNWNAWGNAAVKEWPEATRQAMLNFVRDGKGLVVVHAGGSSFYDWPEYQQMVGASWNLQGTNHGAPHRFYVRVTDPANPVTHGMRIFLTRDELWNRTGIHGGAKPMASAFSSKESGGSGAEEPVAFALTFGKGRTFALVLGHDAQAMASGGFRALLCRGAEWAATNEVTLPAGDVSLSPEELEFVLADVAKYKGGDRRDPLWMLEFHCGAVANTPKAAATAERLAAFVADANAGLDGRRWACKQLSRVGGAAQVPALAKLIPDKDMGTYARFALERIPGEEPLAAMRQALQEATGLLRIGLMSSLAGRRDAKAVPLFAQAAKDADPAVAGAAIEGLGRIGTAEALQALQAQEAALPANLKTGHVRALLRCADALVTAGQPEKAKPVYQKLLAAGQPDWARAAAFAGLVSCDPAGSGPVLAAALKGEDQVVRRAAARLLRAPGSDKLVRAAAAQLDALPADVQAQVIGLVEARGDATALSAVTRAAASPDGTVRKAAISALGALAGAEAVPVLAKAAEAADREERSLAGEALARLRGKGVEGAILMAAGKAQPPAQRELIRALVARGAKAQVPALLALAEGNADAREEAVTAVGELGDVQAAPRMLAMLEKAGDERAALETALVSVCTRGGSAAPVLAVLPRATGAYRLSLLGILGQVGGADALAALRQAAKSPDADVKLAAIKALSGWADGAPLDDLVAAATAGGDARCRILALRGVAQLTPLAAKERDPDKVLEGVTRALGAADRPEEKKQLISAIGSIPCLGALKAAAAALKEPAVSEEAGLAAMQVADAIWRQSQPEAAAVAKQLQEAQSPAIRERAAALLLKISKADNLALGAVATSPDGLDKDGAAGGDQAAIDGDPATYWDEEDGKDLYILRVQLQVPATVAVLRIMGYQHQNYAPKDFEILCDDKVVKKVTNAQYDNNLLTVAIPPTKCSTVELRITGYYGQSPAIRELELYSKAPGQ